MDLDSTYFWQTLKRDVDMGTTLKIMDYNEIIADLKMALIPYFSNKPFYTYIFGSRIMGLANVNSDLDIYVDVEGNHIYNDKPTRTVLQTQRKIAAALKKSSGNWIFKKTVVGRVPIVTVKHRKSNIMCDISFSRKITYDQNMLVNYIFDLQPIARYMVVYLRGWAKKNGLSNFRGHIFILMVIFYFQKRGKLPSISDLQAILEPNFGREVNDFIKTYLY